MKTNKEIVEEFRNIFGVYWSKDVNQNVMYRLINWLTDTLKEKDQAIIELIEKKKIKPYYDEDKMTDVDLRGEKHLRISRYAEDYNQALDDTLQDLKK